MSPILKGRVIQETTRTQNSFVHPHRPSPTSCRIGFRGAVRFLILRFWHLCCQFFVSLIWAVSCFMMAVSVYCLLQVLVEKYCLD